MAVVLVDSNVVLDLANDEETFHHWAMDTLEELEPECTFAINPVIYSEVSIGFGQIEACDRLFAHLAFDIKEIPRAGLFLAGKAFLAYRRAGGTRNGVLPDFFIGAHAAVAGMTLLTRDRARYSTYFPTLDVLSAPRTY